MLYISVSAKNNPNFNPNNIFKYLDEGYHRRHVSTEDRDKRRAEIEEIRNYIPVGGFFDACLTYNLPTAGTPPIYHLSSALSVAAICANRRIWVGAEKLTPNFYICNTAESSVGKSVSLKLASNILNEDPIYKKILLGDGSTEASLCAKLGFKLPKMKASDGSLMDQIRYNNELDGAKLEIENYCLNNNFMNGVGLMLIDELSMLLKACKQSYNAHLMENLTKCADGGQKWERDPQTQDKFYAPNVFLGIHANTTYAWLNDNLTENDILGGFMGRWLFFPAKKGYFLSFREELHGFNNVLNQCQKFKNVKGGFDFTEESEDYIAHWQKDSVFSKCEQVVEPFQKRYFNYCKKIAMLYQIDLDETKREIGIEATTLACRLISKLFIDLKYIFKREISTSAFDKNVNKIIKIFNKQQFDGKMFKSDLLKYSHMRSDEFNKELNTLIETKYFQISDKKPITILRSE